MKHISQVVIYPDAAAVAAAAAAAAAAAGRRREAEDLPDSHSSSLYCGLILSL